MNLKDIRRLEEIAHAHTDTGQEDTVKDTFKSTDWHQKKSGEIIEVETYSTPIVINNKPCRSVIAIDVTEKNQYENKITRAIIKTQEDERYEIGGELHDNVCQILAATQITLGMLNSSVPKERSPLVEQCKEHIKLALDEIRNLSHRLAPAFFEGSNLEEAFESLLDTFNIKKEAQILLRFDDSVKEYPLSMEIQLNLYRILQEHLRNILKYARANVIVVHLFVFNHKLKMQIRDNGIGFDLATAIKGIGLANMKRRTELFSGKFEIITSPGNGCSILVDIPLDNTYLVSTKAGEEVSQAY
jgi:signal transduction histidine kinase